MARTSMVEDVFDMLSTDPWWLGVAGAAIFWICGQIFFGAAPTGTPTHPMNMLARYFLDLLALVAIAAAAKSAIRDLSNRKLLDRQSGLESLRSLKWREFEQLVGEAYRRQGYDIEETGGGGADGGMDLILRGHGETVLVQCKQWRVQQVGVDKVRELFGVLTSEGADRGILVTSGNFTNDAQTFKVGKPLVLVDGTALAQLVHDVQPTPPPATPASSPTSAPACPNCGSPMVIRTAKRGPTPGATFYGCQKYPACKGKRLVN